MKRLFSGFLAFFFIIMGSCAALASTDTWKCAQCNRINESRFQFCPACGAENSASCAQCGYKLSASEKDFRYCPKCGAKLGANNRQSTPRTGDVITFGHYEQDGDISNGPEAIEWLVLEAKDDKALVISKYALYRNPYNTKSEDVTWETCTLREWLNHDFMQSAFSTTEQGAILTTTVSADQDATFKANPGNATQDKIYLLSISEVNLYFGSESERLCKPTAYAKAQGAFIDENGIGWWWLRSPGRSQNLAARVNQDGTFNNGHVDRVMGSIRPAMWISLQSEF